jgi:glycosyltransferase involved in cell wall biosynthesis
VNPPATSVSDGHRHPAVGAPDRAGGDGQRRRPLRVLVVTPIYPWPGLPAEGVFVHRQVRALTAAGADCRVVMFRPAVRGLPRPLRGLTWLRYHPRWLTWPAVLDGVPVDVVFHRSPVRRSADAVPFAVEAVLERVGASPGWDRPDVVLGHWLWRGGAVALDVGARLGAPTAAVARGSELNGWLTHHPHCRGHVARVLERADLVVANCEALRRRAAGVVPGSEDRIRVVYNGCEVDRFAPAASPRAARRALSLPPDGGLLLYCGRVQATKGSHDLAEAWERVAAGAPSWRLVVAGRVTERAAARRLAAAGRRTGGRVTLLGGLPAEAVRVCMQACDVLVHPSHAEGLANVTLEAMAVGLPVVSTDVDGQPELVVDGETGWLVAPRDPRALARALSAAMESAPERRRRGLAGRRRAVEHFDAGAHAARLLGHLAAAAAARGRGLTV